MAIRLTVISALLLICASCSVNGLLYTNKVIPYSDNFKETPIASKVCYVDDFKVKEPVSGFNLQAEWMTSAVINEARKAGIKEIHYADMKIFSVLLGLYTKKTLIVYGD